MEKVKKFIKKFCTKEIIFYAIFGILTTIVNIGASFLLKSVFHIDGNIASTIGIILAVLFAYFTNRKLVFGSKANNFKERFSEFIRFIIGRLFTMVLEIIGVFLLNNVIHTFYGIFQDNIAYLINKCIMTIVVIILNFFISKFFAFKNK